MSTPASSCRTGMPCYMAGGPVQQLYAGVDFMSQSGIYEFGYWSRIFLTVIVADKLLCKNLTAHNLHVFMFYLLKRLSHDLFWDFDEINR